MYITETRPHKAYATLMRAYLQRSTMKRTFLRIICFVLLCVTICAIPSSTYNKNNWLSVFIQKSARSRQLPNGVTVD